MVFSYLNSFVVLDRNGNKNAHVAKFWPNPAWSQHHPTRSSTWSIVPRSRRFLSFQVSFPWYSCRCNTHEYQCRFFPWILSPDEKKDNIIKRLKNPKLKFSENHTLTNFMFPRLQEGSPLPSLRASQELDDEDFAAFFAGPLSSGPESESEELSRLERFLSFGILEFRNLEAWQVKWREGNGLKWWRPGENFLLQHKNPQKRRM